MHSEPTPAAADPDEAEMTRLRAMLADMRAEREQNAAILELEEMKKLLLSGHPVARAPALAWGEEPTEPDTSEAGEELPLAEAHEALSVEDEARLARLLSEPLPDDDDDASANPFADAGNCDPVPSR